MKVERHGRVHSGPVILAFALGIALLLLLLWLAFSSASRVEGNAGRGLAGITWQRPAETVTLTPTTEPEYEILQYVVQHGGIYCQGPFGTPGHRYVSNCYPFSYGTHPTSAYVDGYASSQDAEAEWQVRRTHAQSSYPIYEDTTYGGYPGYDAGDTQYPYAHYESYFWARYWVMGAVSVDDTHFRGSPSVTQAVLQAAQDLGYITGGPGTLTPSPTRTPTWSPSPTWPVYGDPTITPSLPTFTPWPTFTGTPTETATITPTPTYTPICSGGFFTDVRPGDYFFDAVSYLACRGAIFGYSDGTFRPYNYATRGQVCKIVVLAENWPIDTTGGPHFSDVPPSHPYYAYVETMYNHYVHGYDDGTFRPYNGVTRGQFAKIIIVAQGWQLQTPPTPTFSDVPLDNPFYAYIETAYAHGVISGYADGTFRPNNPATRGQISKMVYTALLPGG